MGLGQEDSGVTKGAKGVTSTLGNTVLRDHTSCRTEANIMPGWRAYEHGWRRRWSRRSWYVTN
jgi:hypothetical protein